MGFTTTMGMYLVTRSMSPDAAKLRSVSSPTATMRVSSSRGVTVRPARLLTLAATASSVDHPLEVPHAASHWPTSPSIHRPSGGSQLFQKGGVIGCAQTDERHQGRPSRHPMLQQAEEEAPSCRICLEPAGPSAVAPCECSGTSRLVHVECLERWVVERGSAVCEVCKAPYAGSALTDLGRNRIAEREMLRLEWPQHDRELFEAEELALLARPAFVRPTARRLFILTLLSLSAVLFLAQEEERCSAASQRTMSASPIPRPSATFSTLDSGSAEENRAGRLPSLPLTPRLHMHHARRPQLLPCWTTGRSTLRRRRSSSMRTGNISGSRVGHSSGRGALFLKTNKCVGVQ